MMIGQVQAPVHQPDHSHHQIGHIEAGAGGLAAVAAEGAVDLNQGMGQRTLASPAAEQAAMAAWEFDSVLWVQDGRTGLAMAKG